MNFKIQRKSKYFIFSPPRAVIKKKSREERHHIHRLSDDPVKLARLSTTIYLSALKVPVQYGITVVAEETKKAKREKRVIDLVRFFFANQ